MEAIAVAHTISCVWSTAVAAFDVSQTLYVFCRDTKGVDGNVRELSSETSSLAGACGSLHRLLNGLSQEHKDLINGRDSNLCNEIERCVQDFERTIAQLKGCIRDVKDKRSDSVLKQGIRTIKLNLKKDDIRKFRERIAAHHLSVQTNIATLNAHITLMTSTSLQSQILKHEIDLLQSKKQVVQDNIRSFNDQPAQDPSNPSQEYTLLVKKADKVLSNASSIYEGSEAGASIFGTTAKNGHVADWLVSLEAIREERRSSPDYSAPASDRLVRPQSQERPDPTGFELPLSSQTTQHTSTSHETLVAESSAEEDSDEDTFEVELAKSAYEDGMRKLLDKKFELARPMLLESLSLCQRLSPSQRLRVCDTWDLRFALAVCSSRIDDPRDAQATLVECLQYTPSTSEQRRLTLWLSILLATTYIRIGDLDLALQSSESALKGHRRLLGKNDEATYRSLALTGRIYELKGMPNRARGYLGFIPSSRRTGYVAEYQALEPGSSDQNMECLPQWQPRHLRSQIDDIKEQTDSDEKLGTISLPDRYARATTEIGGPQLKSTALMSADPIPHKWYNVFHDSSDNDQDDISPKLDHEDDREKPKVDTSAKLALHSPFDPSLETEVRKSRTESMSAASTLAPGEIQSLDPSAYDHSQASLYQASKATNFSAAPSGDYSDSMLTADGRLSSRDAATSLMHVISKDLYSSPSRGATSKPRRNHNIYKELTRRHAGSDTVYHPMWIVPKQPVQPAQQDWQRAKSVTTVYDANSRTIVPKPAAVLDSNPPITTSGRSSNSLLQPREPASSPTTLHKQLLVVRNDTEAERQSEVERLTLGQPVEQPRPARAAPSPATTYEKERNGSDWKETMADRILPANKSGSKANIPHSNFSRVFTSYKDDELEQRRQDRELERESRLPAPPGAWKYIDDSDQEERDI